MSWIFLEEFKGYCHANSPMLKMVLLCTLERQEIYFPDLKGLCVGCSGRAQESDCHFPDILKKAPETILENSEIYMFSSP